MHRNLTNLDEKLAIRHCVLKIVITSCGVWDHVDRCVPACMIHEVEVVLHLEEDDECGDDLPDGEAGERVLVAHDQQLTHLDHRLQLSRFVPRCLQARQQLVRLRGRRRGHRPVQDL